MIRLPPSRARTSAASRYGLATGPTARLLEETSAEAHIPLDGGRPAGLHGNYGGSNYSRRSHEGRRRERRIAWINSSGASAGGGASSGAENAVCSRWSVWR